MRRKSKNLSVSIRDFGISATHLGQILGVGTSAALSNLMASVSVAMLNNALLPFGSKSIAAMGIVLKIVRIAQLILTGFAFGAVLLFGYLYGSGNMGKVRELTRFMILFLSSLALAFTLLLGQGRTVLMQVFSQDPMIIEAGGTMLFWQVLGTVFAGLVLFFTVMFQATGKPLPALIMSVSRQGIVFFICLLLMSALFGYRGIIAGQFVSDAVSCLLRLILFRTAFKEIHVRGNTA